MNTTSNSCIVSKRMLTGITGIVTFVRAVLLALLASTAVGHAATNGYLIAPGDQLEISVVGIPELQRRTIVETDGTVSFPLMGTLKVAGQSLPSARANIKSKLALKVYNKTAADGSEKAVVIRLDDITVVISDYRPISVKGAVVRAGQFAYRPSLTVREAVALSGGYALAQGAAGGATALTAVDIKGDYESLWLELIKQQTSMWRLNAELEGRELDRRAIMSQVPAHAPVSRETVSKIVTLAEDQFTTRRDEVSRREQFLKRSVTQLQSQIETVKIQQQRYREAAEADKEELKQLEAMLKKGTIVRSRVLTARRNLLGSETRKLEATAELTRLAQRVDELKQQQTTLVDEQRIRALAELETATVRLSEIRGRMQNANEKLHIAVSPTQLASAEAPTPVITVFRNVKDSWQEREVDESFELQPGDVVEVAFKNKQPAE